jgi:hypothetical protein
MRTIAALLAVFAVGALPTATASAHPTTTNPVALALKLARSYWSSQPTPCGGSLRTVSDSALPVMPLGVIDAWAWATWHTPQGDNDETAYPATYTDCVIHLNAGFWSDWRTDDYGFQLLCDVMTHEVGHFLGYDDFGSDQSNPASIVYIGISESSPNYNSVPQCRHVTLWYGGRRIRG